jgi:hypothetical protein
MTRVLRRPMFRMGGTTEGITSGLSRQGYAGEGQAWEQFVKKIPDIREEAKKAAYQPRGTNVYDFMTEMGLNLASTPSQGGIFQQVAAASKDPYARFMQRKGEADLQEYASESDMFKTMLGSYGDIMAAEAEGKAEGKGWLEQWKFEQIPVLNKQIKDLTKKQDDGIITDDELLDLENAIDQKARIVSLDPVTEAWLKTKDGGYAVVDMKATLWQEDLKLPEDERKYTGPKDIKLTLDAIAAVKRKLGLAEGGRVGYANAGAVMPGAMPMNQAAGPTDQGSEAPPEVQNIDYETLRARLPNTITDDIVRLISTSAEAMEDFATIQTQQDINNFNEKYGVELVLPAEA